MRIFKPFLITACVFVFAQPVMSQQWEYGSGTAYFNYGNVGIGTSSPQTNFHVAGHLAASYGGGSGFVQLWGDNAIIFKAGNASGLRFGSANDLSAGGWSEKMRITNDGFVGIGTTSPWGPLHIVGGVPAMNGGSLICDKGDMSKQFYMAFVGNNIQQAFVGVPSNVSNRLDLGTGAGTIDMTLLGGNVGIGTTNPQAPLHVAAGITASNGPSVIFDKGDMSKQFYFSFFGNSLQQAFVGVPSNVSNRLDFGTGNANIAMTVLGSNVGIGTTTPAYPLTVNGNTNINAGALTFTNGSDNAQMGFGGGGIQITNTGTIRLGYDFHTLSDNVYIRSLSGNDYYGIFSSGTGAPRLKVQQINGKTDDLLQLIDASSTKLFTVTNAGNVGIGTASPQEKLAVKGNILAQKVKVTATGWSDYVFDPGYKLRPLADVENYIQQQHHLPEVPSAAEVQKDGLDVGNNQATLLKKIEELTLYMIEQNKKQEELLKVVEEQRALLKKQQAQIDALHKH